MGYMGFNPNESLMDCQIKNPALRRLLLVACLVLSGPAFAYSPALPDIPRANKCQIALTHLVNVAMLPLEALVIPKATKQSLNDRCHVRNLQDEACFAVESEFTSIEEFLKTQERYWPKILEASWIPNEMSFPTIGASMKSEVIRGSLDILDNHILTKVPAPYSEIAMKTKQALINLPQILKWLKSVNEEALRVMWSDGLRKKEYLYNHRLREYYLDKVLARRAHVKGFKIEEDGLPKNLVTYNFYAFNRTLAAGDFFVDWTGAILESDAKTDSSNHFLRGHSIVMAYLADHVEYFVSLTQFIGQTSDHHGIWGQMFDNVKSTNTPFWGGFWVFQFRQYLGIKG